MAPKLPHRSSKSGKVSLAAKREPGVAKATEIYSEARRAEAPDLVVGYDVGYGCSDQSTLGEIVDGDEIVDNVSRWSGNHLMDPEVVPGVLLSNQKIPGTGHALPDVTATLLSHFGVPAPAGMEGRDIFTP